MQGEKDLLRIILISMCVLDVNIFRILCAGAPAARAVSVFLSVVFGVPEDLSVRALVPSTHSDHCNRNIP